MFPPLTGLDWLDNQKPKYKYLSFSRNMAACSSNDASLFHCVSIYNRRAKQLKDIQLCVTHGLLDLKKIMLHHQTDFFKTLTRKKKLKHIYRGWQRVLTVVSLSWYIAVTCSTTNLKWTKDYLQKFLNINESIRLLVCYRKNQENLINGETKQNNWPI